MQFIRGPNFRAPGRRPWLTTRHDPGNPPSTVTGVCLSPVIQLVLVSEDVVYRSSPDYAGLLFNRGAAPSVQLGQPWNLLFWNSIRFQEAEEDAGRRARPELHLYRPSYQTVGQSWYLLRQAKETQQPEEFSSQTVKSDLHRYRTGYQTVGQSWRLFTVPSRFHEEVPETRVPFRGYWASSGQVVPQPWFIYQVPRYLVEAEAYEVRTPRLYWQLTVAVAPVITQIECHPLGFSGMRFGGTLT